jgi:hypothetical protein
VHIWSAGDHLTHRFNPELGIGRVTAIEGRVIVVEFPAATLRLAANSDALIPQVAGAPRQDRTLIERLAAGEIDDATDFLTRLDILHLLAMREADASACSRTSCTSPSARPCSCRCDGCWPTKSAWAKPSRRRSS